LKESFLKLIGTGLTRSLSSFSIYHDGAEFRIKERNKPNASNIFFKQFPLEEGYKLSVCSSYQFFAEKIKWITADDLLQYM
jgi:4'-phosphopantetheinyl transferase